MKEKQQSGKEISDHAIERFDFLDRFQPHRLFIGGWLQTVSVKLIRPQFDPLSDSDVTAFDLPDDNTPPDTLSGFYVDGHGDERKETVVVLHGMGGHAASGYMCSMATALRQAGHPVILWNNRGAGGSGQHCRKFHHPGYTADLRRLIDHLNSDHPEWIGGGLSAVAFSLGANLLLRYLGEKGEDSGFRRAVSISAPIDMEITSRNLRTGMNRAFDKYLLTRQREELLRDSAELTDQERETILNVGSVWELDDQFTAPRFGYDSAKDFYRDNSAVSVLDEIRTPTLVIHAWDDPVVDNDVFEMRDWDGQGPLFPAMQESGGHTGFYAADRSRWHESAAVKFLNSEL